MFDLKNIVFLDIETVPQHAHYHELSSEFKKIWDKKAERIDANTDSATLYEQKAGIFAEYGKVITISLGFFSHTEGELQFRTKTLVNDDEQLLLTEFVQLASKKFSKKKYRFCAHNGKEFDYPYLCRRMIINQIPLPSILQLMGKKPWNVHHLDTLELWKFGDYKHYTSLETLSVIFGIESSKKEIDGSQVASVYYHEQGLDRIAKYCTQDVIATARIFLHYYGLGQLKNEHIIRIKD